MATRFMSRGKHMEPGEAATRHFGAASGIAFAVLAVVGIFMLIQEQIDEATDQEILSYYTDSGNRTGQIIGFLLVALGVLCFLWFASTLRSRLQSAEPEPSTLSTLGFGASITAAALLVAAAAFFAGIAFTADISSGFVVDPNLARFAVGAGYLLLVGSVLANLVLIAVTSVVAMRYAILPRWLGWAGFVAAVLAVVEAFLAPVFVVPIWVLIVSVVLMRGSVAERTAT